MPQIFNKSCAKVLENNVGMKKNGYRTTKAYRVKYVSLREGDDYWRHPYKLQKQVDYTEIHPECGMVFTDFKVENFLPGRRMSCP